MLDPISQVLNSFVEKHMVSGASALITKNGQERYCGSFGVSNLSTGQPHRRDTLGHMFSTSKPVTAVAVLTLMEQGKLKLTDPLSAFIPEFSHPQVVVTDAKGQVNLVPARREITLFDLLTMTSGIPYPGEGDTVMNEVSRYYKPIHTQLRADEISGHPWSTLKYVRAIGACPLCFHPGDAWLYGLSCDVLGAVVEVITGKTLGEYLEQALFLPLGMKETSFRVSATSRLSQIYTDSDQGLIPWEKPSMGFPMIDNASLESGGAGLISTIDDYSRFARMLLEGGSLEGVHILKPETVALMASDHLTPSQKATYDWIDEEGYSYGFMVRVMVNPAKSYYPTESLGAFGWNGLAGTSIRIDPAKGTTLVFMVQRVPPVHMDYLPPLVQAMSEYLG